ncbi:Microtubule binding/Kinesin motor domain containing protein, putative [Angomonas deanei]|uniref:Kinesin-like protein n=1 Tax=Angomonas deanei TaxID=59799 RepID=A0A7G2C2L8_9TRYP|nr:Microtubule binding/Kinesin motor domain containing protein, putative [Angomonas deanei]
MEKNSASGLLPGANGRSHSLQNGATAAPSLSTLNKAFHDLSNQYETSRQTRLASAPVRSEVTPSTKLTPLPTNVNKGEDLKLMESENETRSPRVVEPAPRSATPPPRVLPPVEGDRKRSNPSPQMRRLSGAADGANKSRDGRIKVVVRKRPFMLGEEGSDCALTEADTITLAAVKQRIDLTEYTEKTTFSFDNVFDTDSTNRNLYDSCGLELLNVALAGGSASCFAYGQTGSGKTHTMMGSENEKGLYAIAAEELFKRLEKGCDLQIAFYEIYCNSLYDLLNGRSPVVLREDHNRKMNICGLTWHELKSVEDLLGIIKSGLDQRTTSSNSVNEHSSRSHAVMCIQIHNPASPDAQMGTLNFVDLAGSERAADTANNDKQTKMEGAEINKSLLALKECIRALDEKRKHIPFRGSKLTEVLRDSFTGNSKTVMIANISPSSNNLEHTANTLRYAFRVKGLSVASITPSRERNAPRPFQLGPARSPKKNNETPSKRSRSSAKRGASPRAASPSEGRHTKVFSQEGDHFSKPPFDNGVGKEQQRANEADPLCHCTPDSVTQFETEIRRRVVQQVQQDIGNEIQYALDERDSVIHALREENKKLLEQIKLLQEKSTM